MAYADDVTLSSPTLTSVKLSLKVVESLGEEYLVKFNPSKTNFVKFGTSNQTYSNEYLIFNCHKICCEASACHPGNLIGNYVKADNVQKNINVFILNLNTIMCHFHMTNIEVKYKLLKSYSMPFYGCYLCDFSGQDENRFYVTWRKCFRRLLNVPYNTHCKLLYPIVSDIPVEVQLHKRFVNFAREVMLSNNN